MKHIFLSFGLIAAIACNEKKTTAPQVSRDSIPVTISVAVRVMDFKAHALIRDTLVDALVPRDADSTIWDKVKKRFYDTAYFARVQDTVNGRPRDTVIQVGKEYVIKKIW